MNPKTIAEQLFFVAVKIDTITEDGAQSTGTGFLFRHRINDDLYKFVVTNKHVVDQKKTGTITFLRRQNDLPALGERFELTPSDWSTSWFGHPNPDIDIAILPLSGKEFEVLRNHKIELFYRMIDRSLIPNKEQLDELDAIESVTFVGYPYNIWDTKHFLPIIRRGITASPLNIDFDGQAQFLIDASIFGGSSGSPVFFFDQGFYSKKSGGLFSGERCYFLGVIAAGYYRTTTNDVVPLPILTSSQLSIEQYEMIDLGVVIKARMVTETIERFLELCCV